MVSHAAMAMAWHGMGTEQGGMAMAWHGMALVMANVDFHMACGWFGHFGVGSSRLAAWSYTVGVATIGSRGLALVAMETSMAR